MRPILTFKLLALYTWHTAKLTVNGYDDELDTCPIKLGTSKGGGSKRSPNPCLIGLGVQPSLRAMDLTIR